MMDGSRETTQLRQKAIETRLRDLLTEAGITKEDLSVWDKARDLGLA